MFAGKHGHGRMNWVVSGLRPKGSELHGHLVGMTERDQAHLSTSPILRTSVSPTVNRRVNPTAPQGHVQWNCNLWDWFLVDLQAAQLITPPIIPPCWAEKTLVPRPRLTGQSSTRAPTHAGCAPGFLTECSLPPGKAPLQLVGLQQVPQCSPRGLNNRQSSLTRSQTPLTGFLTTRKLVTRSALPSPAGTRHKGPMRNPLRNRAACWDQALQNRPAGHAATPPPHTHRRQPAPSARLQPGTLEPTNFCCCCESPQDVPRRSEWA